MKKIVLLLIICMVFMSGCSKKTQEMHAGENEGAEIQIFAAASLKNVMEEIAAKYMEAHPEVVVTIAADSSGTLMTQIEEGYSCDIFFSAAQKQMDVLEADGFVVPGTRKNAVNNQLVVVAAKALPTQVRGMANLSDAGSIALADASVPAGLYTRKALINMGILSQDKEPADFTTQEVSRALGGVEISEQANVSRVLIAVAEGSCEVGTVYYSDIYGFEDKVTLLERVSRELTGDVVYPIAQIKNAEASEAQTRAAAEFLAYVTGDEAKPVFDAYYFDTNVE